MKRNNDNLLNDYIMSEIKSVRLQKGISVTAFSQILKINKQRYSNYESGIRLVPFDLMIKMCQYLGIDSYELYKNAQDYMRNELFKNVK